MWRSKQAGSWGSPAGLTYFISSKPVRERDLVSKIRWTALVEREDSVGVVNVSAHVVCWNSGPPGTPCLSKTTSSAGFIPKAKIS